jgi:hypothetical protein
MGSDGRKTWQGEKITGQRADWGGNFAAILLYCLHLHYGHTEC